MSIAYGRLSWTFLTYDMRKIEIGYSKIIIETIPKLGLKQGDPLSHALCVIVVEALSRALNQVNTKSFYKTSV